MIVHKLVLYFLLAFIPAVLTNAKEGMTKFSAWLMMLGALYQGLLATKAYISDPKAPPEIPVVTDVISTTTTKTDTTSHSTPDDQH